ncbi:hypothetical protein [Boudabousia marimammalium]|uniref:Uncharacterized protein n=1 Tax=Boudabousia marimammalium TaxID=156892 RepID=A0A1Q5PP03_9ACTO|nr:hypothetical protein [Boudabousia marimammalium]OKL49304.1 hypothetical protein BM477_04805 [Boudabousia marimammalium]
MTTETEFIALLCQIGEGASHEKLTEELANVTARVVETGNEGVITYQLKVKPGDVSGTLLFQDKISVKLPALNSESKLMFTNAAGELFDHDPRQGELFITGPDNVRRMETQK